ncbi:hypothetical protein FEM48_Zijuj06G0029500 [Ziziphus jujuba var. spinosa]|uniref:Uncharacterized protein n=1 Tax=Ziziphus jujuba var. spinosa TaxID=714518 RepID=A0A978V6R9_ZIZJJ|nr:hypothetical protein FEM48_Zijuj06G0029500 [Ziziphus jujuba var. spinosa]
MSIFYHEESPIPSKRCKFLAACLKDVFSNCHTFGDRVSTSIPDEDLPPSDFDDEQEVVVSAIRSRAMEKLRKKPNNLTDSFSAASRDAFLSVKTSFSRTPSLNGLEFIDFQRRSIIQELCHCEGWPFGLCRKAVLLPPLPKSPSESWSWSKGTKIIRMI